MRVLVGKLFSLGHSGPIFVKNLENLYYVAIYKNICLRQGSRNGTRLCFTNGHFELFFNAFFMTLYCTEFYEEFKYAIRNNKAADKFCKN